MKLKALRVHGFKSFADSTQIDFHDGITAVVGPNGCGKSNISDAIRWVLGEQRPTAIRGAKMEEAIFQGSVSRRPVNRGSVSMIVSNEDGALPVPYEEVEIGRTVYRDGGSDYQLNRANCRLKDVVDLCRDTGLGANAYSVIENRMIDAILSDRADERRSMFEEAAGIGKYKDRRKAALRRLETAEVDLQRLEDVISEVQTKVRSLARQKGKAQRYEELRARRLAVEVEVVRADLSELGSRLEVVEKGLSEDTQAGPGVTAQLRTAEAELESTRIRLVEAQRARVEVAGQLEQARSDLAQVEKDVAVGEGRISYGEQRLRQIAEETVELETLKGRSEGARAGVKEEQGQRAEELESVSAQLAVHGEATAAVRARLGSARRTVTELEEASRENLKRIAQLEGDHDGAQLQVDELVRRSERVAKEIASGAGALSDLKSQGDLFSDHVVQLTQRVTEANRDWEGARSRLAAARERLGDLRRAEVRAESAASGLEGEHAALGRILDSDEGSGPAVEAARDAFPKLVLGTLIESVVADKGVGSIVDAVLGEFGLGIVVKNQKAVDKLRKWYRSEEAPGGSLVVLPLDSVPTPDGPLPKGVKAKGAGAPWVEVLLGGLSLKADAGKVKAPGSATTDGTWIDRFGAVHLLSASGSGGTLERRERHEALGRDLEVARATLDAARSERETLEAERKELESAVEEAAAELFEARDAARAAEAEASARSDEALRLDRHQEELSRQLQGAKAARERALERGRSAEIERTALMAQEAELHDKLEVERAALAAIDAEWEVAREAESVAAIEAARLENEVGRLTERLRDLEETSERAAARMTQLGEERKTLETELDDTRLVVTSGRDRIQTLFVERDQIQAELNERDQTLEGVSTEASDAERRVRDIRAAERQAVDRRHQLELERQDVQNRVARIRERLEDEWGRPLEVLVAEAPAIEGDKDELRAELQEIVRGLDRLGPVNMLAVEEHAEESERLGFLSEQRDDLVAARDDLRSAIRQINQTATELFNNSFEAIRGHFRETFERLFQGGQADLWLADPESPLESPVEIHASPAGKKTQRIDLLSGGERALTALSLLFGIYLVKPSPFCVLDEVDAPLDESNIGRFIRLLQSFKDQTQFVVITHNPRTIEAADWIYGVTMEEPGVSSIVGVRLQEALETSVSAA